MNDRESHSAEREARRDVSGHPERPAKHEDDVRRYLGAAFYKERKARNGEATEEREEEPDKRDKRR